MSRKIFGEFMKFFLKCLRPFKIPTKFQIQFLTEFVIQNLLDFEASAKRKVVPFPFIYHHAKFGDFWRSRWIDFVLSQIRATLVIGK
jgi:hypothetical protein